MVTTPELVQGWLRQAQEHLSNQRWPDARADFDRALSAAPRLPQLHHNLSLCDFAMGNYQLAIENASQALSLNPELWQSHLVKAKSYQSLKSYEASDDAYVQVLKRQPDHGESVIARADLAMNQFGQPRQAVAWCHDFLRHPVHGVDAQLTTLMASLYDRDASATVLTQAVKAFSAKHLQLEQTLWHSPPDRQWSIPRRKTNRSSSTSRPRVALISPLFCASPVYFLTIAGWRHVAKGSDIVVFNRGLKKDWATQAFQSLASAWHEVQNLSSVDLAKAIHAADIDVLYDLGGWMDPAALKALSVKPAREMFKWVGGQSITTGLNCFDGWIGDFWQSPPSLQSFYTEPLVNIEDGYATYTPPDYLPSASEHKQSKAVIFANPAKVSRQFLTWLTTLNIPKLFIHHQYRYERTRERIRSTPGLQNYEFVVPANHKEALSLLGQYEWFLDTFPYSSGLTAREAMAMGMKIKVHVGELFCERHTAQWSYIKTSTV